MAKTITLTTEELAALIEALNDTAIQMDDDGNEGAFAASPLASVAAKLRAARRD